MTTDFRAYSAAMKGKTVRERVAHRLSFMDKGEGCWVWAGNCSRAGYGLIAFRGAHGRQTTTNVHRVMWEMTYGAIPDGLQVCHHCDNPPCVRPDHLFLGTALENKHDSLAKGRSRNPYHTVLPGHLRGEQANGAKLTTNEVVEIRRVYSAGGWTQQALANKYGVDIGTISRIVNHKRWRHIA